MTRGVLAGFALLLLAVVPQAQVPAGGTIAGRVNLTTRVRSTALPSTIYQPRAVGTHEAPPIPEIRNVVVSLKNVAYRGVLPTSRHEIRQEHEEFVPRVLAVTRGSTVEFPNADPVFHNVFSLASAATFDLGRYPKGHSKRATLTKAGIVKVYCHIHSQMSASILVLDHPYFTVPETDGTFRLTGIPSGVYTIAGWHERVGERVVQVAVAEGRSASVTLFLPVEDGP
jgi:plastocyanin